MVNLPVTVRDDRRIDIVGGVSRSGTYRPPLAFLVGERQTTSETCRKLLVVAPIRPMNSRDRYDGCRTSSYVLLLDLS